MVVPSWKHVFLLVQATQWGIEHDCPELELCVTCPGHPGSYLTPLSRARTACFNCPGHYGVYLTWLSQAGTTCFYLSRPHKGVSNMVVPSKDYVF
eukprot:5267743-Pyramimonas_sp.AAC.1